MKMFKKIIALTMSLAMCSAMCAALPNYAAAEEATSNVGEDGNFDGTVNHDKPVESAVLGDVNNDGKISVADIVLFQKWLLSVSDTKLDNWKSADMNEDGRLDIFDLTLMRKLLLEKCGNSSNKSIEYTVLDTEWTWVNGDNFRGEINAVSTYNEMCDMIGSVDAYENMRAALYERLSDKGVDEEFFDDNVIIVLYGSVGGSTRNVTIDKITKEQNKLTVYTTTSDNGPPSPDMRSYRMILAIDRSDLYGVTEISNEDDFIAYHGPDSGKPKKLTLDDVIRLSKKGTELTLDDLEGYEFEDIGSGLERYVYYIGGGYYLMVAPNLYDKTIYDAALCYGRDKCVDIRTDDVEAFIAGNSPLSESDEIPDGYIAVFHGGYDDLAKETYIYKIDNGAANHGFEYINAERSSFNVDHTEWVKITGQGEVMWTDDVFMVAEENDAYDYVTIPNDDKFYTIEEFMRMFLMD